MARSFLEQYLSAAQAGRDSLNGGALAPSEPVQASVTQAGRSDPLAGLLTNALRWSARHGKRMDPLLAAALAARQQPETNGAQLAPRQIVDDQAQGLARVARVRQSGPRAGTGYVPVTLGDGRRANISFDDRGRRHVFVLP